MKGSRVSIPFIAGQWSLLRSPYGGRGGRKFQSPSLRGSGRFDPPGERKSHAAEVSIPFIAGQWSLRAPTSYFSFFLMGVFQSPSLRGSGRFGVREGVSPLPGNGFNPLHCGAVVASRRRTCTPHARAAVSIPFIAGQWSLPPPLPDSAPPARGFNPLHCGAVVASPIWIGRGGPRPRVSIPFIAGQWSLQVLPRHRVAGGDPVSIPFIAGQWSLPAERRAARLGDDLFQSPSLRGSGRF